VVRLTNLDRGFDAAWQPPCSASVQCDLARCVFGNPFRPAAKKKPTAAAWAHGQAARQMARAIVEEARYDDMPVLGDALEDAGCDDDEALAHCRSIGRWHGRGCWVLDLLRG
jgi:hypothetical protein